MRALIRWAGVWTAALLLPMLVQAGNPAAPFLWQVQGPKAVHYLLGSVHMLPMSAHPLPEALDSAYAATRGLVLEADLADLGAPEFQGRLLGAARDDRPGGIKASIGDKLYKKLQLRAAALGAQAPMCDAFRAWFCSVTLDLLALQSAGFMSELGIDQHYYALAREEGRPVIGLETADEQAMLFIGLSEPMSVAMLAATLDELTSESQDPAELLRMWQADDVAELDKMLADLRKRYPAIYSRLLADRNRAWMSELAALLGEETPQLVIVGAAHLPGPDGLIALLKARGLKVQPVREMPAVSVPVEPPEPVAPVD